jgi:hypothetical protein
VVGPNSNLFVDSFVFNADNTASDVTVSAVKGFFRFISGRSPSETYSIRTRVMTIGTRGTILDIQANGPVARVICESRALTVIADFHGRASRR